MTTIGRKLFGLVVASTLCGCSTFSFAPPGVQTDYRVSRSQTVCGVAASPGDPIYKNFRGARDLIDNFTTAYRCAAHEAADGRQIFEVPSFLALVAAAIGPTFGLDSDGRIAAVAAASVYGRANSYYAPREKIPALDAALDAVLCIKSESVGVAFFDTRAGDADKVRAAAIATQAKIGALKLALTSLDAKRATAASELAKLTSVNDASALARAAALNELKNIETDISATAGQLSILEAALKVIADPGVVKAASVAGMRIHGVADDDLAVSLHEQYFEMVSAALLSVERILATRIKSVGKPFDAAGLQAEVAKLVAVLMRLNCKLKSNSLSMQFSLDCKIASCAQSWADLTSVECDVRLIGKQSMRWTKGIAD
jgi:hypothetical protein